MWLLANKFEVAGSTGVTGLAGATGLTGLPKLCRIVCLSTCLLGLQMAPHVGMGTKLVALAFWDV